MGTLMLLLVLLPVAAAQLRFASYYQDKMVLQRAPSQAQVWGWHDTSAIGATVTVEIGGNELSTTVEQGPDDTAWWHVTLDAISEPGPFTLTARSGDESVVLDDVLVGEVWMCSGQSNMNHALQNIDNAQPDIDDVVNYPNVRTFFNALRYSDTPYYDLAAIQRGWDLPTTGNMGAFSAICWLFGKHLYEELQVPIGMVESSWGGTRIEAWSSPEVLETCFPGGVGPGGNPQNNPSHLWNAMLHPFLPMVIKGAIWYQGEANTGNPTGYACSQPGMVNDWRARWFESTNGQTEQDFAFGLVQLAGYRNQDLVTPWPDFRWIGQTSSYGYVPNPDLERMFMSTAMDLPDFDSPHGAIHPRYKRQIAWRLALGAYQVAYDITSVGRYQGPWPTQLTLTGDTLEVTFDEGAAELDFRSSSGWELCCGPDAGHICATTDATWSQVDIMEQATSSLTLEVPCTVDQFITGIRYLWRESPCPLEGCSVYSVDNDLPVPPYKRDGLISEGITDL